MYVYQACNFIIVSVIMVQADATDYIVEKKEIIMRVHSSSSKTVLEK